MRLVRFLVPAAVTMLCACGGPRPAASAEGVAGCYAFVRRDAGAGALGLQMPDTLKLATTARRNPDGQLHPRFPLQVEVLARRPDAGRDSLRLDSAHVVPWPPAWEGYYALTAWRFVAPDSVGVVLHANMSTSWEFRLRVVGDLLEGQAEEYSDVVEGHPTIAVVGHRVACRTI